MLHLHSKLLLLSSSTILIGSFLIDHLLHHVPHPVEQKSHVELGVASHPGPLVHTDHQVLAHHHEDGLSEGVGVLDHAGQGLGVGLDHPGIS